jgi:hypothetical protein
MIYKTVDQQFVQQTNGTSVNGDVRRMRRWPNASATGLGPRSGSGKDPLD